MNPLPFDRGRAGIIFVEPRYRLATKLVLREPRFLGSAVAAGAATFGVADGGLAGAPCRCVCPSHHTVQPDSTHGERFWTPVVLQGHPAAAGAPPTI